MPTFQRKYLRQQLGTAYLRDTSVGTTTATGPAVVDRYVSDPTLTNQNLYAGAWLLYSGAEFRVASFNAGSGAYLTGQILPITVQSGQPYERHDLVRPSDKRIAIDDVIRRIRLRREVPIPSTDGARFYDLTALASGVSIIDREDVLGVYYFADPSSTTNRDQRRFVGADVVRTATGLELRIDPAVGASVQIVLDAIVTLTLGDPDTATVDVPDERLVLYGAEAKCWDLLTKRAPGTQRDAAAKNRDEAARNWSALADRYREPVARQPRLDQPFSQNRTSGWD